MLPVPCPGAALPGRGLEEGKESRNPPLKPPLRRPCLRPLHELSSETPAPSKGSRSQQASWKSHLPRQFGLLPRALTLPRPCPYPAWLHLSRSLLPGEPCSGRLHCSCHGKSVVPPPGTRPTPALSPGPPFTPYSLLSRSWKWKGRRHPRCPYPPPQLVPAS